MNLASFQQLCISWLVLVFVRLACCESNSSQLLNQLLLTYDKKVRPNEGDGPTVIDLGLFIESLGSIKETTMDFTVTMFLRQNWMDARLAHGGAEEVIFAGDDAEKFWYPDIFFIYEKKSVKHDVTIKNVGARVRPDGYMFRSARITVTLSCNMDLVNFPMDSQECNIQMMSYAYPVSQLLLRLPHHRVVIDESISIPRFNFLGHTTDNSHVEYSTGNFSSAMATIQLERQMQSYILTVFVPNLLLVIIAWLSFWIDAEAAPARVALGVTTILTVTTMTTNIQETLPVVTYAKAIDIYQAACLLFVFLSLLEYAYANYLMVVQVKRQRDSGSVRQVDDNGHSSKPGGALSKMEVAETAEGVTYRPIVARPRVTWITSHGLDRLARIVYPIIFLLFNLLYWTYFMVVSKTKS